MVMGVPGGPWAGSSRTVAAGTSCRAVVATFTPLSSSNSTLTWLEEGVAVLSGIRIAREKFPSMSVSVEIKVNPSAVS